MARASSNTPRRRSHWARRLTSCRKSTRVFTARPRIRYRQRRADDLSNSGLPSRSVSMAGPQHCDGPLVMCGPPSLCCRQAALPDLAHLVGGQRAVIVAPAVADIGADLGDAVVGNCQPLSRVSTHQSPTQADRDDDVSLLSKHVAITVDMPTTKTTSSLTICGFHFTTMQSTHCYYTGVGLLILRNCLM